jgi:hypothetical protein
MDTAMAADQGIFGGGDKRATAFWIRLVARASRYAHELLWESSRKPSVERYCDAGSGWRR